MKRIVEAPALPAGESMRQATSDKPLPAGEANYAFSTAVIAWQKQHGRHALPWQNTRDAYRVWLSEIMLQQTQVAAVIPYYQKFLARFPDIHALAAAPINDVMAHWSGLGYYTRARNLYRCAQQVCERYGGVFPADPNLLSELPGIGRSTAAAIAAFSYGTRAAILDGNVKRVFCRAFGIEGYPGEKKIEQLLWQRAEALLPADGIEPYTQGLMDLGATICTRSKPACVRCPLAADCVALASGRVNELPASKPKKRIPEKSVAMLVIADGGQVLLEQRPDSGIWGGLLSLPQLEVINEQVDGSAAMETVPASIANAVMPYGELASCKRLPALSHTFTHFKMHVAPYYITIVRRNAMVAQNVATWVQYDQLKDAPLPAPIKKLLTGLFTAEDLLFALTK